MAQDEKVQNLIINLMSEDQFSKIEEPSKTELWFTEEQDKQYVDETTVVYKTGDQVINGTKTFDGDVRLNNATSTTPDSTDDSTIVATTAFVQKLIKPLLTRIEELEQKLQELQS